MDLTIAQDIALATVAVLISGAIYLTRRFNRQ